MEFKVIEESDFGDIGEIFEAFFKDAKLKNRYEVCKITKSEAKEGVEKKIKINKKEINVKIPPKTKNNDIIVLKEQENLNIKIHIFGDKNKRKGRIIYE